MFTHSKQKSAKRNIQKKGFIPDPHPCLLESCQVNARLSSVPKGYSHIFNVSIQDERRVTDELNNSGSGLLGVFELGLMMKLKSLASLRFISKPGPRFFLSCQLLRLSSPGVCHVS